MAAAYAHLQTLVVKVGTTLLGGEKGFDGRVMEALVKDLVALKRARDINILVVSSGATGVGMGLLGLKERPKRLPVKQATAAVGQSRLMHYYEVLFETYGEGLLTAQVLLTARDLDDRKSYLNVRNTINTLFDFRRIIPIVNENDSTVPDELTFGDNDTLAAKVAAKINADLLILLSDVDGLYTKNPRKHKDATLVARVDSVNEDIEAYADGTQAQTSIGGMRTKLAAAKIACSSGVPMVIANGNTPNIVQHVLAGTAPCTTFCAMEQGLSHRKRWIAFGRTSRGTLVIDDGARDAMITSGRSLLAIGVKEVRGCFEAGDAVSVIIAGGHEVARGLVNYPSGDISRICGLRSPQIAEILGRQDFGEIIHRDNLVVLD